MGGRSSWAANACKNACQQASLPPHQDYLLLEKIQHIDAEYIKWAQTMPNLAFLELEGSL